MWLVQAMGIDVENGDRVMEVLKVKGIPYIPVGVKPFSTEITGLDGVELPDNVIVYGSTKLVRLAKEMGFNGVFADDSTFNMMLWHDKFRIDTAKPVPYHMLSFFNDECTYQKIGELSGELEYRRFVRPVLDLKAFSGSIVSAGDTWENFFETTFKTRNYPKHIMVAVGRTWPIYEEYRFFVVGGKVVTGSQYRQRGSLNINPDIEDHVWKAAQLYADYWLPHENCVMDLARTDGGIELLEFNCINASGVYAADIGKIVDALTSQMV
jgi:hypothetical protein